MPGAYIWGWDYDAEDWVKCRVDANGKLIIGSGTIEVEQDTPADLQATVTPAAGAEFLNHSRIPDGGVQVAVGGFAENQPLLLHTVTDETTFYLTSFMLSINNVSAGLRLSNAEVTNENGVNQYYFYYNYIRDNEITSMSGVFMPPLEIPEGWKVQITSPAVGLHLFVWIQGYEL